MIVAVPRISVNTQLLNVLSDSTKEVKDLRFIELNLVPVHSVELVIDGKGPVFRDRRYGGQWPICTVNLRACQRWLPWILFHRYSNIFIASGRKRGTPRDAIFTNPQFIPQILAMMSLSKEGEELLRRYVNRDRSRMHLSVRIRNPKGSPILTTIERINSISQSVMKDVGKTFVTGELALYAFQANDFSRSQVKSLMLAACLISVMMMIQFVLFYLAS